MNPDESGAVILIDKPLEWTSFDVVKKIRNTLRANKVGHAGTLDPLATGLLILCTEKKTKSINEYQDLEKEYTGALVLGKSTPSFDLETAVCREKDILGITEAMIHAAAEKFTGHIQQVPPHYSALKVDGKRVYKKAHKGETTEMKAREVHIREFEITEINLPEVNFRVVCSKGTYIRSLANDLGEALGTGAYLSALRRTRIGGFRVEDAITVERFVELYRPPVA